MCDVGLDTIVGFVHAKDVLTIMLAGQPLGFAAVLVGAEWRAVRPAAWTTL